MTKKPIEKKPRTKRNQENSLSASSNPSETLTKKQTQQETIHFYEPFKCKNKTQKEFLNLINEKDLIFATGPAGVGKSYVSIARALELVKQTNTSYAQIIICKPAITIDEDYGFVPGTLREKMEQFITPSLKILDKLIGKTNRIRLEETETLAFWAAGLTRGETIENAIFIMEEAQNLTPKQMKGLMTRIGPNCKLIISGDIDQSDRYDDPTKSGLYDAVNRHKNISEIGFIEFTDEEVNVRHPMITKILQNYKVVKVDKPKIYVTPKVNAPAKVSKIRKFFKFLGLID